jgi:hypothetical protein
MSWFISALARLFLTVVCETIRFKEEGFNLVREWLGPEHRPVILAFWHNRIFYLTYYLAKYCIRRGHKLVVLSSLSRDGEIMARLETQLGAAVVRGSSSRRGRQGFVELCRLATPDKNGMRATYSPVITVDGPRGPKYEIQPGIILLAQKTGLPIIPVSYRPSLSYIFDSWDKFILPLPFSRVQVRYGNPIRVKKDVSPEESIKLRIALREELLKISGE